MEKGELFTRGWEAWEKFKKSASRNVGRGQRAADVEARERRLASVAQALVALHENSAGERAACTNEAERRHMLLTLVEQAAVDAGFDVNYSLRLNHRKV